MPQWHILWWHILNLFTTEEINTHFALMWEGSGLVLGRKAGGGEVDSLLCKMCMA